MSSRAEPGEETAVDEGAMVSKYKAFKTRTFNVLMIGDSRSGKTTFTKYVQNLNYWVNAEIYRGTVNPETQQLVIELNNEFITVNFLDTPGLNELSGNSTSRSDMFIFEVISSFVKQDITQIHLILLTVNAASGFTKKQLESLMSIMDGFGAEFIGNTALLVTNYENYGPNEEKKFLAEIETSEALMPIAISCGAGVFFTGAITETQYNRVTERDAFIRKQGERNLKFINKLMLMKPTSIRSEKITEIKSRIMSFESIVRDYNTAIALGPENKDLVESVQAARVQLSKRLEQENERILNEAKEILEDVNKCDTIPGLNEYEGDDDEAFVAEHLRKSSPIYGKIDAIIKKAENVGKPGHFETKFCDEANAQVLEHIKQAKEVAGKAKQMIDDNAVLCELYNVMSVLQFALRMKRS